jgi:predicted PurR-regulated permease PerM
MSEFRSLKPWNLSLSPSAGPALTTVLFGVIVVAALYFGREVLVPIALAVLMSFVLAPLVRLLQRLYVPHGLAVIAVVLVAFAAVFGLGALMVSQVNQLASDLPRYQTTLREKIQSVRGATGSSGTLERASEVLQELGKELDKPNVTPSVVPLANERPLPNRPIPVEVRQPDPGALQTLVALITPLIHPLTTTGIVVIFVIFILIQRQDLRNRLVRLAGAAAARRHCREMFHPARLLLATRARIDAVPLPLTLFQFAELRLVTGQIVGQANRRFCRFAFR